MRKKIVMVIVMVAAAILLSACASGKIDANYAAYLAAQQAQNAGHKQEVQIFKLTPIPGQKIEMSGVQELTVNVPAAPAAPVHQMVQQPSEIVELARTVVPVVGTVLGIKYTGQAAIGLANAVAGAAKTPQANVTNTTSTTTTTTNSVTGKAVIGGGTLNAVDGTGAAGGNYTDTHPTTTTTTTDNHAVDNHAVDNHAVDNHSATTNNAAPIPVAP